MQAPRASASDPASASAATGTGTGSRRLPPGASQGQALTRSLRCGPGCSGYRSWVAEYTFAEQVAFAVEGQLAALSTGKGKGKSGKGGTAAPWSSGAVASGSGGKGGNGGGGKGG